MPSASSPSAISHLPLPNYHDHPDPPSSCRRYRCRRNLLSGNTALRFALVALMFVSCVASASSTITTTTTTISTSTAAGAAGLVEAPVMRATQRDDVLGYYTLHPESWVVAPNTSCALSHTVQDFWFKRAQAPSLVSAPEQFNMEIPYAATEVDGNACMGGGAFVAVEHDHPYVRDDQLAAVRAWAGVGNASKLVPWLADSAEPGEDGEMDTIPFVNTVAQSAWVVGYDFNERTCLGARVPAPAAYLWFEPSRRTPLGSLDLQAGTKFLIIAFGGARRANACVYVAQRVGGQEPFGSGPVSDPNNPNSTFVARPDPSYAPAVGPPPGVSPAPGLATESPSVSPSVSSTISASPADPVSASPTPADSSGVFEPGDPVDSTGDDGRPSCFPAHSRVTLQDGSSLPLHALRHGHRVLVAPRLVSPVFFFSHRRLRPLELHSFLNISAGPMASLVVSPGHYVHVVPLSRARPASSRRPLEDRVFLLPASRVRPGAHAIVMADGSSRRVSAVTPVRAAGLFAPHTLHGDIVVDGVVASTYTTAVHPRLAHAVLLAPVRWLYRLGRVALVQRWFDHGAPRLAALMPTGPQQLARWT